MEIKQLISEFISVYGGSEEGIRVFASPGRVNLIGEHTDYNGGCVFPAALTMKTTIVIRKRNDNILRLKATDLDGIVEAEYEGGAKVVVNLGNVPRIAAGYRLAPYGYFISAPGVEASALEGCTPVVVEKKGKRRWKRFSVGKLWRLPDLSLL